MKRGDEERRGNKKKIEGCKQRKGGNYTVDDRAKRSENEINRGSRREVEK